MGRLIGFFILAVILANVLGHLPLIGGFFRSTGILGVFLSAMLLSWGLSALGARAVRVRRDHAKIRTLEAVDSAHNSGKLGALYLAQGRPRKARPLLERAASAEPQVAEWNYRLGCARLALGENEEALVPLRLCLEQDEEYAYGAARMRLAQALQRAGDHEASGRELEIFERFHGPSPESAYRRGVALKAAGQKDAARKAFAEVSALARKALKYQRRDAGAWTLRARLASLF